MSKIDCSNVLNYVKELKRMCNNFDCEDCKFTNMNCYSTYEITQEHIDVVQKWSDEHPIQTRKEKFIKMCEENGFEDVIKQFNKDNGCVKNCLTCIYEECGACVDYWSEVVE